MGKELTDAEKEQLLAIFYLNKLEAPALDHLSLRVAESISDEKQRNRCLLTIVDYFAGHGNVALPDQVAQRHLAGYNRAAALAMIGNALAAGSPPVAERYLIQSEELLGTMSDPDDTVSLLDLVAGGYSRLGRWEKAESLASRIPLPSDRVSRLCRILEDMGNSDQASNTEHLLPHIRASIGQTDADERAGAFDDLARAMLATGRSSDAAETWEEALEFASRSPEPAESLYLISEGLARAGRKLRAREIAMMIGNEAKRAAALSLIEQNT
jgi:hypothetical protein